MTSQFVTAIAKGKQGGFALKGGNAQAGLLLTMYEGKRPAGYETMNKQARQADSYLAVSESSPNAAARFSAPQVTPTDEN